MYCRKCGAENEAGSRFCCKCGAPVTESSAESGGKSNGGIKKKVLWVCLAICILAAAAAAALFTAAKQNKEKQFGDNVAKADKYMEELDYDNAKDSYLKAISIDGKQEEPYIQLARIYEKTNEPEKAREILKQGVKNTGSAVIKNRYSLYTYVDEVLIPELGQCSPGTYTTEYRKVSTYGARVESIHSEAGVVTYRIMDFDSDGEAELLAVILDNKAVNEWDGSQENKISLQMYENENGTIVKSDEWSPQVNVFGTFDFEEDMLFLKEKDDKLYICGSFSGLAYVLADGWGFESFVLTYDGGFQKYTGTDGETGGSSFEDSESDAYAMAERLEHIGLTKSAAEIRDTWMMKLSMDDEMDDILFTITGRRQNEDHFMYYNNFTAEELGKIDLEFTIWQQGEYQKAKAEDTAAGEVEDVDYRAAYEPVINQALEDYGTYNTYALWDIDRDGVQELLVLCGHAEADYTYKVYTAKGGAAVYIGEFTGSHTALYGPEEEGEPYIMAVQCHMDTEVIARVLVGDSSVVYEQISSREVPGGLDYYTNPFPIPFCDVSDMTLVDEAG